MDKRTKQNQYITKDYFDETLKKQTQTIIGAVDFAFKKRDKKIDGIEKRVDGIERKVVRIDKKVDNLDIIEKKVDKTYNQIDKFLVVFTKQEQENKLIIAELKVIKSVIKQKLGIDIDELVFAK